MTADQEKAEIDRLLADVSPHIATEGAATAATVAAAASRSAGGYVAGYGQPSPMLPFAQFVAAAAQRAARNLAAAAAEKKGSK